LPFSGGSSGQTGVSAHIHNASVGEGGFLQGTQSVSTGTGIQFNSGGAVPIEVLL